MDAAWSFPTWIVTSTFKRVVKWLLKRQVAKVTLQVQGCRRCLVAFGCQRMFTRLQSVHLISLYSHSCCQTCSQLSNNAYSNTAVPQALAASFALGVAKLLPCEMP